MFQVGHNLLLVCYQCNYASILYSFRYLITYLQNLNRLYATLNTLILEAF